MWLQTLHDQSIHSRRLHFYLFFFFVAFFFSLLFLGKKYDEIGKNRGYLALAMGMNFGPAEQAENALEPLPGVSSTNCRVFLEHCKHKISHVLTVKFYLHMLYAALSAAVDYLGLNRINGYCIHVYIRKKKQHSWTGYLSLCLFAYICTRLLLAQLWICMGVSLHVLLF